MYVTDADLQLLSFSPRRSVVLGQSRCRSLDPWSLQHEWEGCPTWWMGAWVLLNDCCRGYQRGLHWHLFWWGKQALRVVRERAHHVSWAQFHRAAKHKNLLSMKFLPWSKQDYQPCFLVIFRISKQQLNTSNKQHATNWNMVCNPVFIKEELSCYANLCA